MFIIYGDNGPSLILYGDPRWLSRGNSCVCVLSILSFSIWCLGWSGGAMVLGKLPVPGRPTNFDYSRARAYCACSGCGWGGLAILSLVYHFALFSPSLWETVRYRLKYHLVFGQGCGSRLLSFPIDTFSV